MCSNGSPFYAGLAVKLSVGEDTPSSAAPERTGSRSLGAYAGFAYDLAEPRDVFAYQRGKNFR
jgi:hypothetical protein